MRYVLLAAAVFLFLYSKAQSEDFPQIKKGDFQSNVYALDSSANAISLFEYGKTLIDKSDADQSLMVFHRYRTRIKILSKEGYDQANFTIPLYKYGSNFEYVTNLSAKTHNLNDGKIETTILKSKDIFLENKTEFVRLNKFTLPDIQIGSIIDVEYTIVSPGIFNFRSWQFQSNIPKLISEYNVQIPAIYKYNVTLKGPLKLKDTKSSILRECLVLNGNKIDCSNITYIMNAIPPFEEEAHMLAPKNYISTINFELEEMTMMNGAKKTFTKNWTDVDRELMTDKSFGGQLKKTELFEKIASQITSSTENDYEKATNIYSWVQKNIKWNNFYGKHVQNGIEDALKNKSGNVADINLLLVTALNALGFDAYPILVSTRDNGLPNDLHPVISDFNYVITGVKINDEIYLADATDPLLSFGELPLRCINEKGRIIFSKKSSEWIALTNKKISSISYNFEGSLSNDGMLKGNLSVIYTGMDALKKRKEIKVLPSIEQYRESINEKSTYMKVNKIELSNLENNELSLIEVLDIDFSVGNEIKGDQYSFNPIFIDRTTKNPFNLDVRNYHVDLGSKRDINHVINIKLPSGSSFKSAPKNINLTLPNNSARYLYKSEVQDQLLSVTQQLSLKKAIYDVDEYFGLKELFSRIIQQLKIDYTFNYKP